MLTGIVHEVDVVVLGHLTTGRRGPLRCQRIKPVSGYIP